MINKELEQKLLEEKKWLLKSGINAYTYNIDIAFNSIMGAIQETKYNTDGNNYKMFFSTEKEPENNNCISIDEVLNTIHKTIFGFLDIANNDLEEPTNDKDKLLLDVNKAISDAIKGLIPVVSQSKSEKCVDSNSIDPSDIWADWQPVDATQNIKQIPSVTSHPKVGKWIRVDKNKVRCSECDIIHLIGQYPRGKIDWCPNCGAKMQGVEE